MKGIVSTNYTKPHSQNSFATCIAQSTMFKHVINYAARWIQVTRCDFRITDGNVTGGFFFDVGCLDTIYIRRLGGWLCPRLQADNGTPCH
jgi:hypothetical protein